MTQAADGGYYVLGPSVHCVLLQLFDQRAARVHLEPGQDHVSVPGWLLMVASHVTDS